MTSLFVSIRAKLIAIILVVALLTIVPVYMLSGWLQHQSLKNELAQNILINAKVVGEYCVSPLVFEDRPGATDILKKMAHVAYIQSASLYDKNGSIFSFFQRHTETAPPPEAPDYNDGYFMGNTFSIAVPVMYQGKNYGTIVIQAHTNEIIQKTRSFYLTLFPGTLLILCIAVFLAICLQKQISGPITHLAGITRTITTQSDYSIRAPQGKNDEIGYLYSGFNNMLEHLSQREKEQARLENQLHQAQKMESVGRLAGGVAHDFNNILSAIIGYAEICLLDIDNTSPLYENISTILESGHRAARLTQQLLAFSRKQIVQKETLNVKKEIDNIIKMIGRLLGEDIKISVVHGGESFLIRADRSQLEQIILNLSINARDSMPQGGKLTIEIEEIILEEATLNYHFDVTPGDYIRITVSDTGEGMSPDILEHIFEPFYTTKEQGKGTGLGLSTVYGIIKQNKGDIDVYSEPGLGTAFKIYLPRIYDTSDKESMSMFKSPMTHRICTETILLVEDDDMVRKMLKKTLSSLGYTIIEAENGKQGQSVFEAFQGTIDLVLTDVVMPEKNGIAMAMELQKRSPELKVILMSGYTENAIIHNGLSDLDTHFIQKPVTPKTIALAVQNVLDN